MLPEVVGAHSDWGFHMGTLCDGGGLWIGIGCGRSCLVWGCQMTVRGGLVMCRPCDLMSPRPWDGHLTLILAFTWNVMGESLWVGSVVIGAGWICEF